MSPIITSQSVAKGPYSLPSNRNFQMTATIDMTSLPTLPERLDGHLQKALIFHVEDAARKVISTARGWLVRLEEPAIKTNWEGKGIHGYDTGLLYITLIQRLATHMLATGVFFDLLSNEAEYWRFVEFGFHTRNGEFWPGYHFLEQSIKDNEGYIRSRVREAWADTAIALSREAQVAGFAGKVIGLTRL